MTSPILSRSAHPPARMSWGRARQVAGPQMMTFVGTGAGDYVTTTTYTYVGEGAGNLRMAAPTKVAYGRIGCILLTLLVVGALIAASMMPATTTTVAPQQQMAVQQAAAPAELPQKMGECSFWGDPHIHTFDGAPGLSCRCVSGHVRREPLVVLHMS